jgi:LysR family glycine cleavage system transcriptional activator
MSQRLSAGLADVAEQGRGGRRALQRTVWVDSFEAALQLAEQGAGVALGLSPLFDRREAAGAARPAIQSHYPTGAYWLVHRPEEEAHPALRLFTRWLRRQLADE